MAQDHKGIIKRKNNEALVRRVKEDWTPLNEEATEVVKALITKGFAYFTRDTKNRMTGIYWDTPPLDVFVTDEGMLVMVMDHESKIKSIRGH